MNQFLIPANSKKSMLIFGLFRPFDLGLFGAGVGLTLLLLPLLPIEQLLYAVIALIPALIAGFLVFPIPNYHNVRTVIMSVWRFYTERRIYYWKGWCFSNGEEKDGN
ncbi:MAG: hypothetical protein E7173_01670 [Firmicutes bacterium]|nr:hypothetical protein [Bacillota bacterium]